MADASRCPAPPGQLTQGWNGLACGAAAGTLHPAADRPLSRPPGHIPRPTAARVKDASRSFGPASGRP
jgi:hypothetical protein